MRLAAPLSLCLLIAGCAGDSPAAGPEEVGERYLIRGQVMELPKADGQEARIKVRHEEIPQFRNRSGEVEGMASMTMSFGLLEPATAATLQVGDKISAELIVRWDSTPRAALQEIEVLSVDTALSFAEQSKKPD